MSNAFDPTEHPAKDLGDDESRRSPLGRWKKRWLVVSAMGVALVALAIFQGLTSSSPLSNPLTGPSGGPEID